MTAALLLACWVAAAVAVAPAVAAGAATAPGAPPPTALLLMPLTWETVDFQYYVNAVLGQAGTAAFRLLLDTGSGNLWVPGNDCSSAACAGRARLDPSAPGAFQVFMHKLYFCCCTITHVHVLPGGCANSTCKLGCAALPPLSPVSITGAARGSRPGPHRMFAAYSRV